MPCMACACQVPCGPDTAAKVDRSHTSVPCLWRACRPHMARIQLPPTLVEAIAGAMGEVAQIIALYPLDTIKVSWQAARASSQTRTGVARSTCTALESIQALGNTLACRASQCACEAFYSNHVTHTATFVLSFCRHRFDASRWVNHPGKSSGGYWHRASTAGCCASCTRAHGVLRCAPCWLGLCTLPASRRRAACCCSTCRRRNSRPQQPLQQPLLAQQPRRGVAPSATPRRQQGQAQQPGLRGSRPNSSNSSNTSNTSIRGARGGWSTS